MNNDDKLKSIISNGAELAGSAAAGALGFLAAGLIGAAEGAVGGSLLSKVLNEISSVIYDRFFERRERVRIGTATIFALETQLWELYFNPLIACLCPISSPFSPIFPQS